MWILVSELKCFLVEGVHIIVCPHGFPVDNFDYFSFAWVFFYNFFILEILGKQFRIINQSMLYQYKLFKQSTRFEKCSFCSKSNSFDAHLSGMNHLPSTFRCCKYFRNFKWQNRNTYQIVIHTRTSYKFLKLVYLNLIKICQPVHCIFIQISCVCYA